MKVYSTPGECLLLALVMSASAMDHTIYELCLPSEFDLGMRINVADLVSSGKYSGTCVSVPPVWCGLWSLMERFCQGVGDASQRMFGCLWRVLCDSHGPTHWTWLFQSTLPTKAARIPSSHVHVVVARHHHVGVGGAGTRAHVSCCRRNRVGENRTFLSF